MRLRNKYTSKVVELEGMSFPCDSEKVEMKFYYDGDDSRSVLQYDSFDELKDEWEKYEESKEYWCIGYDASVYRIKNDESQFVKDCIEIGNYFETKEEAEKAVEKLKAWKRLKDKGFRFKDWSCALQELYFTVPDTFYDRPDMVGNAISDETTKDLTLLFGGEDA